MRVYILIAIWLKCAFTDEDAYIGCFYDGYNALTNTPDRYLRVLPLGRFSALNMTIGRCINYCVDLQDDIQYAGLEIGEQCYCGTADADYDQGGLGKRPDEECLIQSCLGNENQTCGDDFKIAIYNLSLIRCQLPESHTYLNSEDFVSVQNFITFKCLREYTLVGTPLVQCIFDDSITDTRWERELPICSPYSENVHSSSTGSMRLLTITTESSQTSSSYESGITVIIAGAAGGAALLVTCVIVVVIGCCWKKRRNIRHRESTAPVLSNEAQNNYTSDEAQNNYTSDEAQNNYTSGASSYATVHKEAPVYTTVNRDSYKTPAVHATNGEAFQHHDNYDNPPVHNQKKQKPMQPYPYSYTDVTINLSKVPDVKITDRRSDTDDTEESGWAENDLYSWTGDNEEEQEGWNDNSLYATTSH
ncbi:uncharacterized protein [Amphiura filiformis]|uniref:uncharacterized protein n=1 Tax=Amphiura filiformis TaxID=82378 RepID=UPI003B213842